ncbi:hypothetical protein MMC13_003921, partial [Lambiella insularis]|nr:hypothetical protein [Lambiella insularis]
KYPGPLLAKVSAIPNFYYALTGDRHIWLWQCDQIYGHIFRYSPNGLMINTPTGYKAIHNNHPNVKKATFYEVWTRNKDDQNTFNIIDRARHAQKRRILNSVFSEKAVRSAETFVIHHVNRWCELLLENDSTAWSEPKNMADWTDYLVFDILGDLCFGSSFEIKEPKENTLRVIPHTIHSYVKFMNPIAQSPARDFLLWLKPRGLDALLERIAPEDIKRFYAFVESSVKQRTALEEKLQEAAADEKDRRKDMFHFLFAAKDPETGNPAYTAQELYSEANLLIIAGSDTTAITLSAAMFYLTRNPLVYRKLCQEIRSTFNSVDDIRSGLALSSCTYLRSCINETLRISTPGVTELPREVLKGGLEVDGDIIPEGTIVGAPIWVFNHNEDIHYDPFVYRPERWIVNEDAGVTADDVARAESSFFPFSNGVGNCVGQKLAMLELMVTIARLLYRMDMRMPPGDTLGEGRPELGWGRRQRGQFQQKDAYVSLREGPMVQFRKREV